MSTMMQGLNRKTPPRAGRGKALAGLLLLCSVSLLTSCVSSLQGTGVPAASLPKVEITPPAKFTKGAPAYSMHFHTMASGSPSSAYSVPTSVSGLIGGAVSSAVTSDNSRLVTLRMVSHPGPSGGALPKAYHMVPPGMNMGDYLPLLPPVKEPPRPSESQPGKTSEPERFVIKIYWGCGESVRKGQPRVFDTSKMKGRSMPAVMEGMGSAGGYGGGRFGGGGSLKAGWVEVLWPNKEDTRQVPSSASLVGGHFIHGNFLPHIRFTMDARHEIMEKLALSAEQNSLKEAIPITWKKLPTAIGYHLMAFAYFESRKEMVIWTSSENPDISVGGQFLDTPVVKKHIASKIIMPADRDRCVIPKGIFDGADMVMVSGTAWGEDYWASEPPRPANPPKGWKPDWAVKGQFLSTGGLMLGAPGGGGGSGASGAGGMLRGLF